MSKLQVVLGWEALLEADPASLPALRGVSRALGVQVHWDDGHRTLHLAPPLMGKRIALVVTAHGQAPAWDVMTAVRDQLARVGALVWPVPADASVQGMDLILRIELSDQPPSEAPTPRWLYWKRRHALSDVLQAEITAACRAAAAVTRTDDSTPDTLTTAVTVGAAGGALLAEPGFPEALALGVYRGLCRYWAPPELAARVRALCGQEAAVPEPVLEPEPMAEAVPGPALEPEPQPEPEPEPLAEIADPALAPGPEPEPDLVVVQLDPEPAIILQPEPAVTLDLTAPDPDPAFPRAPAPDPVFVPEPEAAVEPPPPPATPADAAADTLPPPRPHSSRPVVVFGWKQPRDQRPRGQSGGSLIRFRT